MPVLLTLLLAVLPCFGQGKDTDRIALHITVRDDVALRLAAPAVRLELATSELVPLVDDGSVEGDIPGDHVWLTHLEIRRAQKLSLSLEDTATGTSLGGTSVFLPAAGEATLVLRTIEGDPGFILEGEDGASATGDGVPAGSSNTPATTTTTVEGSGDRFAYLVWVVLLLGLLGFGYARIVLRRIYQDDFLPTWRKLDRWLDTQLED